MEYVYDSAERRWYNTDRMEYEDNFDPKTNRKRLKVWNDSYGRFGSRCYKYRDSEDVKLIFANGDIYGYYEMPNVKSSFWIEKGRIVDYDRSIKNINQDFSYLGRCIYSYMDCLKEPGKGITDSIRETVSRRFKEKLTEEQKLYIELNRSELGLDGIDL